MEIHKLNTIKNIKKRRCIMKKEKIQKGNDQYDRFTFIQDIFAIPSNDQIVAIGPPGVTVKYKNFRLHIPSKRQVLKPSYVINDYPTHFMMIIVFNYKLQKGEKFNAFITYKDSKFDATQTNCVIRYNPTPKYRLTVTTKILNESHNMKEWIEHYLKLGVEHFYIYKDFKTTDTEDLNKVLTPYISSSLVTLIEWPYHHGNCTEHKFGQMGQINHAIYKYGRGSSEWLFIGDVDEYIVPKYKFNKSNFIDSIVKQQSSSPSILKIQTYWFGGQENTKVEKWDTDKTKKYIYRKDEPEGFDNRTKCIVRPEKVKLFRIHQPDIYEGELINVSVDKVQINHYFNFSNWQTRDTDIEITVKDESLVEIFIK